MYLDNNLVLDPDGSLITSFDQDFMELVSVTFGESPLIRLYVYIFFYQHQ